MSCAKDIVDLTGDIQGVVKDASSGQMIENCQVSLTPSGKSVITSSSGSFEFKDLEPGDYTLTFSKAGYIDGSKRVTVITGEVVNADISLELIKDTKCNILGVVKDAVSGQLIENCQVSLTPSGKSVITSSSGSFEFKELEPGDYTLTFSKSGYIDGSKQVTVITGESVKVDISLTQLQSTMGNIHGIVKDLESGLMIENCQITISPTGNSVITTKTGDYEFKNLEPGDYTLTFSKSGYNEDTKRVVVVAGETTKADMFLKAKSSFVLSEEYYDFGDLESSKSFYVYNNSGSDCSYTFGTVPQWLILSKKTGSVSAGSNDSFTVSIDRSKVNVGEYSHNIVIDYKGQSSGSVILEVRMKKVEYSAPEVITASVATEISKKSFKIEGSIVKTGGAQITAFGHCWSTTSGATVDGNHTNLGMTDKEEVFVSTIEGLQVNTEYYVRAYATNQYGTSYGDEIKVRTQDQECDVWDGNIAQSFAGGSGTPADPYRIETGAQLVLVKKYASKCFVLVNNINLDDKSWPSFDFSGTLDGNGYTIFNLKVVKSGNDLGLFSVVTGTVKNLILNGVDIQAGTSNNVGSIAGTLEYSGSITNCTVNLNSKSKILGNNNVGGIVGYYGSEYNDYDMTISNCNVTSTSSDNVILGNSQVGGIVGMMRYSQKMNIINCCVEAVIFGSNYVGGICGGGQHSLYDTISNCSFNGKISGQSKVAGIYGGYIKGHGNIYIIGCKVNSIISVSDNYAGGVYAYGDGGIRVRGCYVTGSLTCDNYNAKYLGGIGGFTDFDYSDQQELCYSTMISNHSNFGGLSGYSDLSAKDCASVCKDRNVRLNNCNTSCTNITDFLRTCFSDYADYYNFNNTWTWSGDVNGILHNISCPKLFWE